MEKQYIQFTLRSIDAIREPEGSWSWNDSYTLEEGIIFEESQITARKILQALRKWDYLSDYSKGKIKVNMEDNLIEICLKGTLEPIFALMEEKSFDC